MRDKTNPFWHKPILWILVASTFLRLASAFYQGDAVTPMPGVHDQISYEALALRIVDGHGFSFGSNWWPATAANEPTAHWSFLYTLYLALIYLICGPHPLAARLVQAFVAGIIHPWLVWRIGNRFFSQRVALIASLMVSSYTYFVFYSGALMTETFYILVILWTFDAASRLRRKTGASRPALSVLTDKKQKVTQSTNWIIYMELGIAIGIAVLLRQVFLLFVPILLGWAIWQTRPQPAQLRPQTLLSGPLFGHHLGQVRGPLLSVAVILLLIAPWTIRNYRAFDSFVLLNTNAGFAFFWGNHPIHGDEFVPILPTSYGELIPDELRGLNEAEMDRWLLRKGLEFIAADPVRFSLLSLSRLQEYFKFWPTSQSGFLSNLSRITSFGLSLPLILIGLGVRFRRIRWKEPGSSGWILMLSFVVFNTLIHLLSWSLIRYRLPIDTFLLFFAALGVTSLYDAIRARVPSPQFLTAGVKR